MLFAAVCCYRQKAIHHNTSMEIAMEWEPLGGFDYIDFHEPWSRLRKINLLSNKQAFGSHPLLKLQGNIPLICCRWT